MMLWDIIRDWFVQYVFGGTLSSGEMVSGAYLGTFYDVGSDQTFLVTTGELGHFDYLDGAILDSNGVAIYPWQYIDYGGETIYETVWNLGDWLSSTATIITLIALCLFLFLAVKWVFNVFRNTLERVGK